MVTTRQSTKFNVVDVPVALPGHCFMCRAHDREFFLDTGMNLEREDEQPFEGALYICSHCLAEMAHAVNYLTPIEAKRLQDQIARQNEQIYALEVRNGKLEHAVDSLSDCVSDGDALNRSLAILVDPEHESIEGSQPVPTGSELGPSESNSVKGLGDLFSLNGPE